MQPLISVIVPVYKSEQYLEMCIDSIVNQTYKNLEIILVDDGSPDNCGQLCDEYATTDLRIRVIHKENGGVSHARNVGLEFANGEYISFVDSDDWIEPNMLELLWESLKLNNADMSCCGRYDVYNNKRIRGLCPIHKEVISSEAMLVKILRSQECDVACWDKLFHRSLLKNITFPVGEIHEEAAIIHKIVSRAKKISLLNIPLYNYRHREQSLTTSNFSEKNLVTITRAKNIMLFVKEYYPQIIEETEFYYNKKLIDILVLINISSNVTRRTYSNLYKEILIELSKRKKYLSKIDKVKYYMLRTKTYRFLKKIEFRIRLLKKGN